MIGPRGDPLAPRFPTDWLRRVGLGVVPIALAILGAGGVLAGALAALAPSSRSFLLDLLVLAAGFTALSHRPLRLPSGSLLHPGTALSLAGVFLLPPSLLPLISVPGLVWLTHRSRRPWWAYFVTFGHATLSLETAAAVYHVLAPTPFLVLPLSLPAALAALAAHEVVQWTISAALVAHRQGHAFRDQLRTTGRRDLNWGTVGMALFGLASALSYLESGLWGFLLQTALLVCLFRAMTYYTHLDVWQQAAWTDGLTGAANRRAWEAFLHARGGRAQPGTLFVLDVDGFKQLNDRYGHVTGDEVLRSLVHHLHRALRKTDMVFRYGGDEFVVVVPHEPVHREAVRHRLHLALEAWIAAWAGQGIGVSASVGEAACPEDGQQTQELFALADGRMYWEKLQRHSQRRDEGFF